MKASRDQPSKLSVPPKKVQHLLRLLKSSLSFNFFISYNNFRVTLSKMTFCDDRSALYLRSSSHPQHSCWVLEMWLLWMKMWRFCFTMFYLSSHFIDGCVWWLLCECAAMSFPTLILHFFAHICLPYFCSLQWFFNYMSSPCFTHFSQHRKAWEWNSIANFSFPCPACLLSLLSLLILHTICLGSLLGTLIKDREGRKKSSEKRQNSPKWGMRMRRKEERNAGNS
jgi:hypothetical protein